MRRALALLLVGIVAMSAGCVSLDAARIPDKFLEGRGGNGWEKNMSASQREPQSTSWGMSKSQSFVYEDKFSDEGYPGTLTVSTLRTLLRPSADRVAEVIEERIREEAEKRGVRIDGSAVSGNRRLGNGAESNWFVHDGTVESTGAFFSSRNARVKIYGEVFSCAEEKSVVVIVALAQTTDVRSVGGVPLPNEADPTTWREIVADPRGSIEAIRGSEGLAYNVAC